MCLTADKAVFTLGPVLFRILANRTRRVDLSSGLHSHYKRLTRRERYTSTSPRTHCFATGCDPLVLFFLLFPLCRGEASLLVTAKYGYFRD